MRVVSVNVGLPRIVSWKGEAVTTSIFKEPVDGPVPLVGANLEGDGQADRELHGGPDKAVYSYPAEYYSYWRQVLGYELPWGMFGENLTVEGMPTERETAIGDRFRIGMTELVVTQPRLPCFKLGIRFDDDQMVRRFLKAGRTGYYLRVAAEGTVAGGDEIEPLALDAARVPVSEITRLFTEDRRDEDGLRRVLAVGALPAVWRRFFEQLLRDALADGTPGFVN